MKDTEQFIKEVRHDIRMEKVDKRLKIAFSIVLFLGAVGAAVFGVYYWWHDKNDNVHQVETGTYYRSWRAIEDNIWALSSTLDGSQLDMKQGAEKKLSSVDHSLEVLQKGASGGGVRMLSSVQLMRLYAANGNVDAFERIVTNYLDAPDVTRLYKDWIMLLAAGYYLSAGQNEKVLELAKPVSMRGNSLKPLAMELEGLAYLAQGDDVRALDVFSSTKDMVTGRSLDRVHTYISYLTS